MWVWAGQTERSETTSIGRPNRAHPRRRSTLHRMDREFLEHYLSDESRRGPAADGAFSGAAGGAACGDLSRLSLIVADGRIDSVTFDAEGCGATRAATA